MFSSFTPYCFTALSLRWFLAPAFLLLRLRRLSLWRRRLWLSLWPHLWLSLCRPLLTHLLGSCARRLLLRTRLLLTHLLWRCAGRLLLRTWLLLVHLLPHALTLGLSWNAGL